MPKQKKSEQKPIEQYQHTNKERVNNPPVGLVTPQTDPDGENKRYEYDPHLDPQLNWAGKAEHTSFEVPTVSLHVHERIDPRTIVDAVRKRNTTGPVQLSLFDIPEENPPIRQAIEFYKHKHNWTNRLVAGDSLLVMNSLLEKEGMGGQVQMIYIDPPYGIKYGSNFQPFVNKRDVKDGKDEDLTQEPEMIKAFRDTWELGIHSYLSYLRDRLLLARELLSETGSVFVQISDDNVHLVRNLMDEVFGSANFQRIIAIQKRSPQPDKFLSGITDYLVWYSKSISKAKYNQIFIFNGEDLNDESFVTSDLTSSHEYHKTPYEFQGKTFIPINRYWSTSVDGLKNLEKAGRLVVSGNTLRYKRLKKDWSCSLIGNIWTDVVFSSFGEDKLYAVQTSTKVVSRCVLMTTDPGDLVLDITCGSGTTAYVAEQWGRRWITCDTSRVAITLAKQRLMTATFDYYQLANPQEGIDTGLKYKTVPHITLKSIANNPEIKEGMTKQQIEKAIQKYADQEILYDRPLVDTSKIRVTGPFTMEAVPAPVVMPVSEIEPELETEKPEITADNSISRSGESLRQSEWRDELLKTGIRGKSGQAILFSRVETFVGNWLHADAETKPNDEQEQPLRAVISFGPVHAPLDQRQVELALEEAQNLVPKPKLVIFAAFQFDPEAAKDIDETKWQGVTLLKVQMNADLLTEDLKKKRATNESFWLMGQPDVIVRKIAKGENAGKWEVEVQGFDYYNTRTGLIESGNAEKIAMWMLDSDYDGRSILPSQVFFPMAGEKEGWFKLAKSLKAEIDEDLIEAYRGTISLPFEAGEYRRIAVKIVDDRGIESIKMTRLVT
ncbi:site-specific DNA-methyltransferase [Ancylothrix sp. C2]|uniref:site-specific DNA-methyltransferase n=1 Tax=Ancylothrix sp. D3o TaxID=2953691 RepID=UPI0021BA88AB|nr:site-specific DNA-methyltransferase [Ancylothrix sp. D3o]MCT7951769.1 site-specific DNA-methyltransferase [Ancylothrix sp. D3o]